MKNKLLLLGIMFLFMLPACKLGAQPFANEIAHFATIDSVEMPKENSILFIGSSSFRMWDSLQNDFPDYVILNRAFGGSTLNDLIYYADQVIFKYNPKQILIYCGDNDLAASENVKAPDLLDRFKRLFGMIRKKLPNTQVTYVSIKPSPSRIHLFGEMKKANHEIEQFLNKQDNTAYVDVFNAMLDEHAAPDSTLFIKDRLHLNRKGYAIWQKLIEPVLID